MHPIERLRYMARAGDVGTGSLVYEAAMALGAVSHDRAELVLACRQLIEHRPSSGPLVWLSARMLTGGDAGSEAWDASEMIERDKTPRELEHALPGDTGVVVVGSPELSTPALVGRGDIEVFVLDTTGEGYRLVHRLDINDRLAVDVPLRGLGSAVADADLVVLETDALGPDSALCAVGSLAAAATAKQLGTEVWLTAGVGRCLPASMWEPLRDMVVSDEPWEDDHEVVSLDLIDRVVGPGGPVPVAEARFRIDCPVAPELFR
ncbi:MAG: hypothetical protein AAGA37_21945 [Actinomycetota bacterium]